MTKQKFMAEVGQWDPEEDGPWELFVCRLEIGNDGTIIDSRRVRSVLLGSCTDSGGPSASEVERAVDSLNEGWTLATPYADGQVLLSPGRDGTIRSALLGDLDADLDEYDAEAKNFVKWVETLDAVLGMRGWRLDDPDGELITWIFPASDSGAEYEEIDGKPVEGVTSLVYCPTDGGPGEIPERCGVILVGAVDLECITVSLANSSEWLPLVEAHRRDEDHSELDRMAIR